MSTLHSNIVAKSIEEAFQLEMKECIKKLPCIIYLPHIDLWWETASDVLKYNFVNAIEDLDANMQVLLVATAESFPPKCSLFSGNCFEIKNPKIEAKTSFFAEFAVKIYDVTVTFYI